MRAANIPLFFLYSLIRDEGYLDFQNMDAAFTRSLAQTWGFKEKSINKLITGPAGFRFIRMGTKRDGYELVKKWVTPIELALIKKMNDDSPLMARVNKTITEQKNPNV